MSELTQRGVVVCDLGQRPYVPMWDLQKQIQARLIAAKRATPPERIPNVLLLVEHPHVYTLGKSGNAANLLLDEAGLARHRATYIPIDRGGDITYHGPGQLVAYPLLDLDRFFTDIHRYLRELEEAIIRTCADYGVQAGRVDGRTGVWVGPDTRDEERKICAMGIRCSRWVTMHGLAFNVNTDLSYFGHIVPCGIADRGVTSLAQEVGMPIEAASLRNRFITHFAHQFGASTRLLSGADADEFLNAFISPTPAHVR